MSAPQKLLIIKKTVTMIINNPTNHIVKVNGQFVKSEFLQCLQLKSERLTLVLHFGHLL